MFVLPCPDDLRHQEGSGRARARRGRGFSPKSKRRQTIDETEVDRAIAILVSYGEGIGLCLDVRLLAMDDRRLGLQIQVSIKQVLLKRR